MLGGALVAAVRVSAAWVRVTLRVLLFIPVAAVICLAGLFVLMLITAVLIVETPFDIGLDRSPDRGIGDVLSAYLCKLCCDE